MISIANFRKLALSFEGTVEMPHFEKTSFRVNKKIFASLDLEKGIACLKFSLADQSVFCSMDKAVYAVPNKWGLQGWTFLELEQVNEELAADALRVAYDTISIKKSLKK